MITMMAQVGAATPGTVAANGALPSSHVHHAMQSSAKIPALPSPALLFTALFTAAAVMFTFLLIRGRVVPKASRHAPASKTGAGAEHALEAIGAAVMAVMFSAMTT
jgi:hypothetical protein